MIVKEENQKGSNIKELSNKDRAGIIFNSLKSEDSNRRCIKSFNKNTTKLAGDDQWFIAEQVRKKTKNVDTIVVAYLNCAAAAVLYDTPEHNRVNFITFIAAKRPDYLFQKYCSLDHCIIKDHQPNSKHRNKVELVTPLELAVRYRNLAMVNVIADGLDNYMEDGRNFKFDIYKIFKDCFNDGRKNFSWNQTNDEVEILNKLNTVYKKYKKIKFESLVVNYDDAMGGGESIEPRKGFTRLD